jgi:hypothetical protein
MVWTSEATKVISLQKIMESEAVSKLFEAAVKVIKNLPKEGPFQPSNEVKLKVKHKKYEDACEYFL